MKDNFAFIALQLFSHSYLKFDFINATYYVKCTSGEFILELCYDKNRYA